MTSWYSNILTKTSSQISSLRSTLLSSDADGDTEDDTHVCRVLRNYYTDKGRPFPPWLPPDPKAPAPAPQPMYAQASQVGARYGGMGRPGQQQPGQPGGGLSSLWDNNNNNAGPATQQPQSLRAGRHAPGGPPQPQPTGRPSPAPAMGAPSTAQDRLKQRLWGSRGSSPSQGNQSPYNPPGPAPAGGSQGGNYEDRFAPGGMYDGGGGGAGGGRSANPYASANSPWAGGGGDYYEGGSGSARGGGGGGGGGGGWSGAYSSRPRRDGLPSGPRAYR